jgi:hypothetical protein
VFDRHLRLTVMDAIERVEVALRTGLVTELVMRHGPFAHTSAANFPAAKPGRHSRFLQELREEAERSRERVVQHFKASYDEFPDLPLWTAVETMTFGSMLTFVQDVRSAGAEGTRPGVRDHGTRPEFVAGHAVVCAQCLRASREVVETGAGRQADAPARPSCA